MELYSLPSFSSRGYDYEGSLGSRNPGFYGGSKIVSSSQCENLIDFLSLIFYVKSILENQKVKIAVFAILRALNFINLANFSLPKVHKVRIQILLMFIVADSALLEFQKLISRKI